MKVVSSRLARTGVVVIALTGITVAAASLLPKKPRLIVVDASSRAASAPAPSTQAAILSSAEQALPGMTTLMTDTGIRRKVLVHERGIELFEQPETRATGRTAPYWQPLFLFEERLVMGRKYYRVGTTPRTDSLLGWVSSEFAAEWNYRPGAELQAVGEGGRTAPLLVYPSKEGLLELLNTGDTQEEPIARAVASGKHYAMPWPIAESARVLINGRTYEVSRLLFLGEFTENGPTMTAAPAAYSPEDIARISGDLQRLDVVFCVDNTASTAPFLAAIKQVIKEVAGSLAALGDVDLALGLTLYRDYVDEILFDTPDGKSVAWTFPLAADLGAFNELVAPLQEAKTGSVDLPEAGYDGLHSAISKSKWRGELSERVVIWVSDNSQHPLGDARNPRNLSSTSLAQLAKSRETHVTVFSICIRGDGPREEQDLHRRQCSAIAKDTGGEVFDLDGAAHLVERIKEILRTRRAHVASRIEIVEAAAAGTLAAKLADATIDAHDLTHVVEFLAEFGGVEFARIGPRRPVLGTGWVVTESGGAPTLLKKVYIARAEVSFLISELLGLVERFSPETVEGVAGLARQARTGDYFKEERPEAFHTYLAARGVPCRERSIVNKTRAEWLQMGQVERLELIETIDRLIVPELVNARTNADLFPPSGDNLQFGWIPESLLP